ncbi:hypothetical protein BJ912DRAFT_845700, partial [Pholiota molesta]
RAYLLSQLPDIKNLTLCNLHISLSNCSHVKYYIDLMKEQVFPHGTGWKGKL